MRARASVGRSAFLPTRSQAVATFDRISLWGNGTDGSKDGGRDRFEMPGRDDLRRLTGAVLAHAIIPCFANEDFTDERISLLLSLPEAISAESALPALVY